MKSVFIKGLIPALAGIAVLWVSAPSYAAAPPVFLDEMTWKEIQQRIDAGSTTVIIPTGGTGQEGLHMVEGKHNTVVRYTAGEIAKDLGDTLVTPVVPFVPEGRISPPEGHMQFAGTLSLTNQTFAAILEDLARSLKQHGFKRICFIGDHGGAQAIQKQVAEKLTGEWERRGVRVIQVSDYYSHNGQEAWTDASGTGVKNPTVHGGHIETSELLALNPGGVHDNMKAALADRDYRNTGGMGDSTQASAKLGHKYLSLKIEAAVRQIQHAGDEN